METLDWNQLDGNINPNTKVVSYEQNKHLFTKVAFDVFQLNSSPVDSLWVLEQGEDGTQFLVAQYDDESGDSLTAESAQSKDWTALSDKEASNVTLYYKDQPIQRFASTEFGFSKEDVHIFQKTLVEKLGSDKNFRNKFLNDQPAKKRDRLLSEFPELVE